MPRVAAPLTGLVVLIGGARSGKSRLAVRLASRQERPVLFIATGEAGDGEMAERIALHRAERPAGWQTIEEPRLLIETLSTAPAEACVVLDCLSLWVANLIEQRAPGEIEAEAKAAATIAAIRSSATIAVTNEVGLGVVPATPLGRLYRDVLGRVNAAWVDAAASSFFVVAGRTIALSEPLLPDA